MEIIMGRLERVADAGNFHHFDRQIAETFLMELVDPVLLHTLGHERARISFPVLRPPLIATSIQCFKESPSHFVLLTSHHDELCHLGRG